MRRKMGSGQPVRLEKSLSDIETFTHTMLDYQLDPGQGLLEVGSRCGEI